MMCMSILDSWVDCRQVGIYRDVSLWNEIWRAETGKKEIRVKVVLKFISTLQCIAQNCYHQYS
jgi:hypothetical protein